MLPTVVSCSDVLWVLLPKTSRKCTLYTGAEGGSNIRIRCIRIVIHLNIVFVVDASSIVRPTATGDHVIDIVIYQIIFVFTQGEIERIAVARMRIYRTTPVVELTRFVG